MSESELAVAIVKEAKSWTHVTEQGNNAGFTDAIFTEAMRKVGWRPGDAWCAFFGKMVWHRILRGTTAWTSIQGALSGSVMATWRNAKLAGLKTTDAPVLGGLVCWSTGNGRGHMGVVVRIIDEFNFFTVEGNTNQVGSREGDRCMEKRRQTNMRSKLGAKKNWNYLGCIHPPKVEAAHDDAQATPQPGAV